MYWAVMSPPSERYTSETDIKLLAKPLAIVPIPYQIRMEPSQFESGFGQSTFGVNTMNAH